MNVMSMAMFLTCHQTCDVIRIARHDMFHKNAKCKEFIFHETSSPKLDSCARARYRGRARLSLSRALQTLADPCQPLPTLADPCQPTLPDPFRPCPTPSHPTPVNPCRPMRTSTDPPCRTPSDPAGPLRTLPDPSGPCRTLPDPAGPLPTLADPCQPTLPDPFGPCRTLPDPFRTCRTLASSAVPLPTSANLYIIYFYSFALAQTFSKTKTFRFIFKNV